MSVTVACRAAPGWVVCRVDPEGIAAVSLLDAAPGRDDPGEVSASAGVALGQLAARVERALAAYLGGSGWHALSELPVAWPRLATPFDLAVSRALRQIPEGRTATYGAIARLVGRPGGARAVGRACGRNPLPLVVPCHRVVPATGGLGGFSAGLAWKEWLLRLECGAGVCFAPSRSTARRGRDMGSDLQRARGARERG